MSHHENSGRNVAPVYLVADGELLLDAPVDQAWPQIIDYPSWQDYSSVEHISGEAGKAGEIVLLKKDEEGFEFPPYFARTIKIEPESRVIWKTYPQENPDAFFGIVEFRASAAGDKTRFVWSVLYEFMVPYADEGELKAFELAQYDNFQALFDSVLPKLVKRVQATRSQPA